MTIRHVLYAAAAAGIGNESSALNHIKEAKDLGQRIRVRTQKHRSLLNQIMPQLGGLIDLKPLDTQGVVREQYVLQETGFKSTHLLSEEEKASVQSRDMVNSIQLIEEEKAKSSSDRPLDLLIGIGGKVLLPSEGLQFNSIITPIHSLRPKTVR